MRTKGATGGRRDEGKQMAAAASAIQQRMQAEKAHKSSAGDRTPSPMMPQLAILGAAGGQPGAAAAPAPAPAPVQTAAAALPAGAMPGASNAG